MSRPEQLSRRSQLLYELIREDPAAALAATLPPDVLAQLRQGAPAASSQIETAGDWTGTAEALVEDDFEHGVSTLHWRLRQGDQSFELYFAGDAPPACSGSTLRVTGIRVNDRAAIASWSVDSVAPAALACSTTGSQNVAILLVSFPSQALPANITPQLFSTAFFGPSSQSVDGYWREASHGLASASGNVFGPFVLDADYTCDQFDAIRAAAIKAADGSVNLTAYSRLVIIMPNRGSCGIGLGTLGCEFLSTPTHGNFNASVAWLRADFVNNNGAIVSVSTHELGHGLGLNHANLLAFPAIPLGQFGGGTDNEYADGFSTMGSSNSFNGNFTLGHYAARHKAFLGWQPPSTLQTIETAGTFTLAPYESSTTALQVLKVRRGAGNDVWLWLEYRQALGYDATLSLLNAQFNGALIHYQDALALSDDYSYLLNFHPGGSTANAALAAGESWSDPYSLLRLQVNSASSSGLGVTVGYDSPCATLSPTAPSLPSAAGSSTISVSVSGPCNWNAVSNSAWITITGGQSGTTSGTVTYAVTANNVNFSRTGTITIARQTVTVTQAAVGCSYSINPTSAPAAGGGGPGSVGITTGPGCAWTAFSQSGWLTINTGSQGFGSGTVNYTVTPNLLSGSRIGTLIVAGNTFTVNQAGAAPPTATRVGMFRQGFLWVLDANGNHLIDGSGPGQDYIFGFGGLAGDIPIFGDWNGDGHTKVGFVRNGNQFFLDYNGNRAFDGAVTDRVYTFGGLPGDIPVIGDWTGNGTSKIGIYRNGLWILDLNGNGIEDPAEDAAAFSFGGFPGDIPIVGDWTGSGKSNVGVFRQGFLWVLDTKGDHSNGAVFPYGGYPGDLPITGDWMANGVTQVGILRQGFLWVLDANGNHAMDDGPSFIFAFGGFKGPPADVPVAGKW